VYSTRNTTPFTAFVEHFTCSFLVLSLFVSETTPTVVQSERGAFRIHSLRHQEGTAAAEAMGRPRPKRGERRIDAAIDHLAQYGFAKPQIRKIINELLQVAVSPLAQKSFLESCRRVAY
jgi:hypothetical protein